MALGRSRLAFVAVLALSSASAVQRTQPILHAHNDYLHPRPLLDAIASGCSSVEADLFLVDGKLLVGHTLGETKPGRTLQSLYLEPLKSLLAARGGWVHREKQTFTLLIDLKVGGDAIHSAITEDLKPLTEWLTMFSSSGKVEKGLTVLLSGARSVRTVAAGIERPFAADGFLEDVEAKQPATVTPWISLDWRRQFSWVGVGPFTNDQSQRLRQLVDSVHGQGKLLRFWGTADRPGVWSVLRGAGVDIIASDDLEKLRDWSRGRSN